MENATRAMIMAASVILGVMILTFGVALFTTVGDYSQRAQADMDSKQISEFNIQFSKYYNGWTLGNSGEPVLVTAHEIVSLANRAKENNTYYDLNAETGYNETTRYIQIDLVNGTRTTRNFEKKPLTDYTTFINENSIILDATGQPQTKYYYCTSLIISQTTQRVVYMSFTNYN